jgi:hypothetical protein
MEVPQKLKDQVTCYMRFEALNELMLDQLSKSNMLKVYDKSLENRLRNIGVSLSRVSKNSFSFVENSPSRDWFYAVTNMFEQLFSIEDPEKFSEISEIILAYLEGEIKLDKK